MAESGSLPVWLEELGRFLRLRPLFLLHGNIYDQYLYPKPDGGFRTVRSLRSLLELFLGEQGYEMVIAYDIIDGFEPLRGSAADFMALCGQTGEARLPTALGPSLSTVRAALASRARPVAAIFDFASRLTSRPNELAPEESQSLLQLLKGVQGTQIFHDRGGIRNLLLCVCDKQNDLPAWLFLDNPLTKAISIPRPEKQERRFFIESQQHRFFDGGEVTTPEQIEKLRTRFVDLTDGMTYRELESLRVISVVEKLPPTEVRKIADLYKYGVRKSLWEELGPAKIREIEPVLRRRVKGQEAAILRATQIVKRAAAGLTGINRPGPNNRPRGVMFFAGPTGVGKTELAKALADHIFGDEASLVRFDMSEYSHEHSDEKLLGSPPGYVGHDEGGQLTNRIKARPFSIILFDEIEKAHPRIFDKFLQILDDGRITDGRGDTVYFSESLIIFTSNLGMYTESEEGGGRTENVRYGMPYAEVRERILGEIRRFFNEHLGRPEIYNRFGENFVVFDFVTPEIGRQITDQVLDTIVANFKSTRGIELQISAGARDLLFEDHVASNLAMGGRGVHNKIEEVLINPLSSFLVDNAIWEGKVVRVGEAGKELNFDVAP